MIKSSNTSFRVKNVFEDFFTIDPSNKMFNLSEIRSSLDVVINDPDLSISDSTIEQIMSNRRVTTIELKDINLVNKKIDVTDDNGIIMDFSNGRNASFNYYSPNGEKLIIPDNVYPIYFGSVRTEILMKTSLEIDKTYPYSKENEDDLPPRFFGDISNHPNSVLGLRSFKQSTIYTSDKVNLYSPLLRSKNIRNKNCSIEDSNFVSIFDQQKYDKLILSKNNSIINHLLRDCCLSFDLEPVKYGNTSLVYDITGKIFRKYIDYDKNLSNWEQLSRIIPLNTLKFLKDKIQIRKNIFVGDMIEGGMTKQILNNEIMLDSLENSGLNNQIITDITEVCKTLGKNVYIIILDPRNFKNNIVLFAKNIYSGQSDYMFEKDLNNIILTNEITENKSIKSFNRKGNNSHINLLIMIFMLILICPIFASPLSNPVLTLNKIGTYFPRDHSILPFYMQTNTSFSYNKINGLLENLKSSLNDNCDEPYSMLTTYVNQVASYSNVSNLALNIPLLVYTSITQDRFIYLNDSTYNLLSCNAVNNFNNFKFCLFDKQINCGANRQFYHCSNKMDDLFYYSYSSENYQYSTSTTHLITISSKYHPFSTYSNLKCDMTSTFYNKTNIQTNSEQIYNKEVSYFSKSLLNSIYGSFDTIDSNYFSYYLSDTNNYVLIPKTDLNIIKSFFNDCPGYIGKVSKNYSQQNRKRSFTFCIGSCGYVSKEDLDKFVKDLKLVLIGIENELTLVESSITFIIRSVQDLNNEMIRVSNYLQDEISFIYDQLVSYINDQSFMNQYLSRWSMCVNNLQFERFSIINSLNNELSIIQRDLLYINQNRNSKCSITMVESFKLSDLSSYTKIEDYCLQICMPPPENENTQFDSDLVNRCVGTCKRNMCLHVWSRENNAIIISKLLFIIPTDLTTTPYVMLEPIYDAIITPQSQTQSIVYNNYPVISYYKLKDSGSSCFGFDIRDNCRFFFTCLATGKYCDSVPDNCENIKYYQYNKLSPYLEQNTLNTCNFPYSDIFLNKTTSLLYIPSYNTFRDDTVDRLQKYEFSPCNWLITSNRDIIVKKYNKNMNLLDTVNYYSYNITILSLSENEIITLSYKGDNSGLEYLLCQTSNNLNNIFGFNPDDLVFKSISLLLANIIYDIDSNSKKSNWVFNQITQNSLQYSNFSKIQWNTESIITNLENALSLINLAMVANQNNRNDINNLKVDYDDNKGKCNGIFGYVSCLLNVFLHVVFFAVLIIITLKLMYFLYVRKVFSYKPNKKSNSMTYEVKTDNYELTDISIVNKKKSSQPIIKTSKSKENLTDSNSIEESLNPLANRYSSKENLLHINPNFESNNRIREMNIIMLNIINSLTSNTSVYIQEFIKEFCKFNTFLNDRLSTFVLIAGHKTYYSVVIRNNKLNKAFQVSIDSEEDLLITKLSSILEVQRGNLRKSTNHYIKYGDEEIDDLFTFFTLSIIISIMYLEDDMVNGNIMDNKVSLKVEDHSNFDIPNMKIIDTETIFKDIFSKYQGNRSVVKIIPISSYN